jgi:hypothetical protein
MAGTIDPQNFMPKQAEDTEIPEQEQQTTYSVSVEARKTHRSKFR